MNLGKMARHPPVPARVSSPVIIAVTHRRAAQPVGTGSMLASWRAAHRPRRSGHRRRHRDDGLALQFQQHDGRPLRYELILAWETPNASPTLPPTNSPVSTPARTARKWAHHRSSSAKRCARRSVCPGRTTTPTDRGLSARRESARSYSARRPPTSSGPAQRGPVQGRPAQRSPASHRYARNQSGGSIVPYPPTTAGCGQGRCRDNVPLSARSSPALAQHHHTTDPAVNRLRRRRR
jgi:hypothetical protein